MKFVLKPGYVISKNDGDTHFISYHKLMRCYGLLPDQVELYDAFLSPSGYYKNRIILGPRYAGDYKEHLQHTMSQYVPSNSAVQFGYRDLYYDENRQLVIRPRPNKKT